MSENQLTFKIETTAITDPMVVRDTILHIKQYKNKFNFLLSKLLYDVREGKLYQNWPDQKFDSFEDWGKSVLDRNKSVIYAIARVYEVFVINFQIDPEELLPIDWSKLSVASAHATAENVQDLLQSCRDMTLLELQAELRRKEKLDSVGEESNAEKSETFSFKVADMQIDTVKEALTVAEELSKSTIPGKIFEYICADFLCSAACESSASHLDKLVQSLESAFNVKITVSYPEGTVVDGQVHEAL
jgi:hypothetical protein